MFLLTPLALLLLNINNHLNKFIMKTNRRTRYSPLEKELISIYKDIYPDELSCHKAVNDALRAYSFIKQDALYRNASFKQDE